MALKNLIVGILFIATSLSLFFNTDIQDLIKHRKISKPPVLKVMVIDTGINEETAEMYKYHLKSYYLDQDEDHGSAILQVLAKDNLCDGVEIYHCTILEEQEKNTIEEVDPKVQNCFVKALKLKIDVINASFKVGLTQLKYEPTRRKMDLTLKLLNKKGTIIFKSAGNSGANLRFFVLDFYIATRPFPNIRVVGALDFSKKPAMYSNFGWPGMIWENGYSEYILDGKKEIIGMTSGATAIATGKYIKNWCENNGN